MPANPSSLRLTEAYRRRVFAIRERVQAQAERLWPSIDELDGTDWPERMATLLTQAQAEATRASAGYLTAYLSSELRRRVRGPVLESRRYAGLSRDGRPLSESLRSPIIGVLGALKEGKEPTEALAYGRNRAVRMVGVDLDHAGRQSLLDGIEADGRIEGWQRVVRGTCGACAALATGVHDGLQFEVHPGCQCVSAPVVSGVADAHPFLTGVAIFAAKSKAEQDEMLGAEAAEKVRAGEMTLRDLVGRSKLETDQPDFITQTS